METHPMPVHNKFARKRQRNPANWKMNLAKKLKYSAKFLPERICNHNTKALQCSSLTMAELMSLHNKFYAYTNKMHQDSMILKFCSILPVTNRVTYTGKKQTVIKHSVIINNRKVPICQKFFMKIFGVTKHRISYVMRRFYYTGDTIITEHRGGDRKQNIYGMQKESVHKFVQSLSCIESHYCRTAKTAVRKYLSSELNLNKLYYIFKNSEISIHNVKKSYFRHIFNNFYNIGFGTPKTDVCSKCLELKEKIKSETDFMKKNVLITEKRVHSLRAKAFFEKLREYSDDLKIISFDFQKNLPLPKLPDQMAYYSRQLYYYNFTMVEGSSQQSLAKERVFAYYCTENEFSKDSNLVASAVYHRLSNTNLTGITTIRLMADGCGGQNKNCILVGTCCKWLLDHQSVKAIELVFPVTGHSYMPTDRQFGIIEKKLKKLEVLTSPDEISDVIGETSTLVKFGTDCPVYNWRDAVKNVVKVTTSWPMAFKECKRFILKRSKKAGNVLVRGEMFYKSDLSKSFNICQRQKVIAMVSPQAMSSIVPVNKNKLTDVNKLLCKHFGTDWRDIPSLNFYNDVLNMQDTLTASSEEESYCTEALDESNDLRII